MATKLRREIEPRWVSEYVVSNYPGAGHRFRVPLGPPISGVAEQMGAEKALRVSRPWRPEVDAIVTPPDRLIAIEGKIQKMREGLGQLHTARLLIDSTPELAEYRDRKREFQLLVVRALPWVLEAAKQDDVKVVEWAPPYVVEVWEERDKYWAPEAVKAREERKEVLRKLGYD